MAPWNFKDQSWGETGKPPIIPIIPTIAPIPLPYLCHEKPNKQGKSWAVSDAASPKDAIDCRQCNQCLWHRTSVADCLGPFLHDAREAARSILLQCSDFSFWKGRGMQEPCSSMFIHVHPCSSHHTHIHSSGLVSASSNILQKIMMLRRATPCNSAPRPVNGEKQCKYFTRCPPV